MVVEGRQKVRDIDHARVVVDEYARTRGMDVDALWTWLVIDEDYEDGCTFTRAQVRREVEWAWRNELRLRAILPIIRITGERIGLNHGQIVDVARNVALNADVMSNVK
jgi:hypothetical protein